MNYLGRRLSFLPPSLLAFLLPHPPSHCSSTMWHDVPLIYNFVHSVLFMLLSSLRCSELKSYYAFCATFAYSWQSWRMRTLVQCSGFMFHIFVQYCSNPFHSLRRIFLCFEYTNLVSGILYCKAEQPYVCFKKSSKLICRRTWEKRFSL